MVGNTCINRSLDTASFGVLLPRLHELSGSSYVRNTEEYEPEYRFHCPGHRPSG